MTKLTICFNVKVFLLRKIINLEKHEMRKVRFQHLNHRKKSCRGDNCKTHP